MAAKNTRYFISLLSTLFLFSCAQGENNSDSNNEQAIEKPLTIEARKAQIFEENKNQIKVFYDDVGFEIINLILEERVYKTNGNTVKLRGVSLDDFPEKLTDTVNETKVKQYSERLIEFKNQNINAINSKTLLEDFRKGAETLLTSSFYKDTLIAGKVNDPIYIGLKDKIDEIYEQVESNLTSTIPVELARRTQLQEPTIASIESKIDTYNQTRRDFSNILKPYTWWIFGLLMASVLLNLLQFFKHKKTKKYHKKALGTANNKGQKETHRGSLFQPKSTRLNAFEVKSTVEQAYVKFQQNLTNQYHKDCFTEVSIKFDNLKTDTILEASSSSFYNKTELQQFIDTRISQDRSTLSYELKDYVVKNDAKHEIDNRIIAQNFVQAVNTKIVSEQDVANKVSQLKQMAVSELPDVTNTSTLNTTINILEKDIKMTLQKMVQNNSVFYFAFADAKGTLQDAKKTKAVERDSAIQLSLNSDDITKATFRLLLEKGDMMQAGIMSYDSFLIPICELTSDNFNSTGTTIEQIGPDGTMELENGIWKVKNKLPIKVI